MTSRIISGRAPLLAALAVAAAVPASAGAHVTLQPRTAAAGGYTVETVRVPNESDDASTTKVDLQLPGGFASVLYSATPGWKVKVTKAKLATPVKTDDGEITEEVRRIVWTADSTADGIGPGEFKDFPLSVKIPGKEGDTLTFKALQTYSDGSVARWIGAPDADMPAPQITVTAATDSHAAPAAATADASEDDGDSDTLAIVALVVGVLGLLAAGAALLSVRRRRA